MSIHRYDPGDDLAPLDVDARLASWRDLRASKRANPDAVPVTLDQCEALVAHFEALKARQERGPNATLARLLASPASVLAVRDQWPQAADLADGADQLADAYRAWLLASATAAGGAWTEAIRWLSIEGRPYQDDQHARALHWLLRHAKMPFPVGKACSVLRDGFPAAAARDLMPFEDDAVAAVVLPVPAGERTVTLYFLARQEPHEVLSEGKWLPDTPVPVIDGNEVRVIRPIPRQHRETIRTARLWWKSLAGLPTEPGRPKGRRRWTARDLINELRAYKNLHGPDPPTRDEFLEYIGIEATQWQRLKGDWGIGWLGLRRGVYGATTRKRAYTDRGLKKTPE